MGLEQRPGITITENLISSVDDTNPYIPTVAFLSAERGVGNKNTTVTDQVDFINKFGYPTEYNYKTWYNIYEYLRYTNYINVMRVVDADTYQNYGIEFGMYFDGDSNLQVLNRVELTNYYNDDIAINTLQNYTIDNAHTEYTVINREATQTQDIAVSFCTTEDEYDSSITTENDIILIEDVWDDIPTQLLSGMELHQVYILNTDGTYTIKAISYLTDEDIQEVLTVEDVSGNYLTQIKITNNSELWDGGSFAHTSLYFRDTKKSELNNEPFGISGVYGSSGIPVGDDAESGDTDIYIVLTENVSLYDTTGKVIFYDKDVDITATSVAQGYLKSEELYITITGGDLSYADSADTYEYVANGGTSGLGYPTCTRIVYDSKIQNSTDIKTYRQLVQDVDFNKNFIFLVFKKYSGKFSLMEVYEVAKERDTSIHAMYKRNYCEDVINQNSKYVYFVKTPDYIYLDTVTSNNSITELVLEADNDTTDFTDLNTYSTFETATNFYRNTDNISFKYLLGIELNDGTNNNMNLAPLIANDRKDCIAILSPWNENDYLSTYNTMTSTILHDFGIKYNPIYVAENNTYTIVYDNMKMIYSEFLEEFIWVPTIGDVAGIYVVEDTVSVYSACAGYRTQPIKNVLKMLHTDVSDDNRDLLSYNSINHIIKNYENNEFYLYDILMYHDKDVLTKRLNIRRTINEFKYRLRLLLKPYIYEFNSYNLRQEVSTSINTTILNMIDAGALYDGYAICDGSNNSPNTINQNELHIQIALQPTQVIRQIHIEINIEKQTLNISEAEL